jgi:hypothetical protein
MTLDWPFAPLHMCILSSVLVGACQPRPEATARKDVPVATRLLAPEGSRFLNMI